MQGNPLPVVDAPDKILEQEPEDGVVVNEPEEQIAGQELVLVPEEELGENPVGAGNDDFILDFDLDDDQEEIPMDQQNLANVLQELQDGMDALRTEHTRIGNDNHAHVTNIENQVRNREREHQNNLPGLLPTVAPNSLFEGLRRRRY